MRSMRGRGMQGFRRENWHWLLATGVEQRLFSWLEIKIQSQFLACLAIARLRNLYATDMDVVWNLY